MADKKDSPSNAPLKRGRCPRCGIKFTFESVAQHKTFPFCSQRCRDVDLGNWLAGKYVIPGQELPKDPDDETAPPNPDELGDDGT